MKYTSILLLSSSLLVSACHPQQTEAAEALVDSIAFIHINDIYRIGDVEEGRRGALARVSTVVRALKEQGRDVRVTHGGDFLYPSLESQLWNGEQMIEALNFINDLALMYVVPGNHEFDRRTADAIVDAVRGSNFTWLADNMQFDTGQPDVDSALRNAQTFSANSHKVGIFALTISPSDGGNDRDYVPIDKEYLATAEESIQRLQTDGAELVFGLTHLDLADDKSVAKLKKKYPAFMFIVGGHDHEPEFVVGDWLGIEADVDYRLVAPDYLYRGGNGYDFSQARDVSRPGSELRYLVLHAILLAQASGQKIGRPVDDANPRIAMLQQGQNRCFN